MFKQTLLDLFDEVKGNHSRVKNIDEFGRASHFSAGGAGIDPKLVEKVIDAEYKLEKIEGHFDHLATSLQEQL